MTPRFLLKNAAKWTFVQLGYDAILASKIQRLEQVAILNLHRIHPDPNPYWPAVRPKHFEQLLEYLHQRFHVIALEDLPRWHSKKHQRPPVLLSFDDAYLDFIEYADPLLRKYGVRANLNIIPECVETGLPPWNIQLYDFLRVASPSVIERIAVPGFPDRLRSSRAEEKARYGASISRFLKCRPRSDRAALWGNIAALMAEVQFPTSPMMRREHVLFAAKEHDVGAHSYAHESMGYEDDAYFRGDVQSCQRYFDDMLGMQCDIYAFPNGSYRADQVAYLRETGFRHALLVDEQFANPQDFALTRLTVSGGSICDLRLQAVGYRAKGKHARGPIH